MTDSRDKNDGRDETSLTVSGPRSMELAPTQAMAEAQFDIQSAITIARRFPRDEVKAEKAMLKSAERPVFADEAIYSYPRGYKEVDGQRVRNYVEGKSVVLAREAARIWGNIRYGFEVTYDDEEDRKIRAYAYDMETNVKITGEDSFKKLVQRKIYANGRDTGETQWLVADERELRELTNRRAAILVRNCILQVIPSDITDNVQAACEVTLRRQAEANRDQTIGRLVKAFESINISLKMIETKLGKLLKDASADELTGLRKIFASIRDGNSSWSEYTAPTKPPEDPPKDPNNPEGNDPGSGSGKNSGHLDMSNMRSGGSEERDKTDPKKETKGKGKGKGKTEEAKTPADKPSDAPPPSSGSGSAPGNPDYAESEDPPNFEDAGTGSLFPGREPGEEG